MSDLVQTVGRAVSRHRLIPEGARVLVGVSGGADSLALLVALHRVARRHRFSLAVAHLNHGIRGAEADRDAAFVAGMAARLGVPCMVRCRRVAQVARERKISVEMAARACRHEFFAEAARTCGAAVVALAHTSDDQAETVLLRLVRGTGPQGLGGMAYASTIGGLTIVRPLLEASHEDAVAFLRGLRLPWREDRSNRSSAYARNRVRFGLLPFLEKNFNPGIRQALVRMAELCRAEGARLDGAARRAMLRVLDRSGQRLNVARWGRLDAALQRRVLVAWLYRIGAGAEEVGFEAIERIVRLAGSRAGTREAHLPNGIRLVRRYGVLAAEAEPTAAAKPFRCRLRVPGVTDIAEAGLRVTTTFVQGFSRERGGKPGDLPARGTIGRSSVGRSGLFLRPWKEGDRMRPLGLDGSVKLQDLFVDRKVPRDRRKRIPVLECRGQIAWIPGYRVGRGWEVQGQGGPGMLVTVEPLVASATR
jgi:tRNA(Ile)-lysidine synthase